MNVVWFVLDTLRPDHLGCYGYFRDTSPHIDRLAAEGVVFEDSYASAIATGPGFTSLLTGLAAINHGFYLTPWKLIWHKDGTGPELFHQQNDPMELNDRAGDERAVAEELAEKLRQWVARQLAGRRSDPILAVDGAWTCYIGRKGDRES